MKNQIVTRKGTVVENPPIAQFLFGDVRMAWVWLILRLWLGYQWFNAGQHKISNPASGWKRAKR